VSAFDEPESQLIAHGVFADGEAGGAVRPAENRGRAPLDTTPTRLGAALKKVLAALRHYNSFHHASSLAISLSAARFFKRSVTATDTASAMSIAPWWIISLRRRRNGSRGMRVQPSDCWTTVWGGRRRGIGV
jgi:hypothetical protein